MYDNIGSKIKNLAKTLFIIEAILGFLAGIIILAADDDEFNIIVGLILMIAVPLISWISSWLLYGFGELIEKTCEVAYNTNSIDKKVAKLASNANNDERNSFNFSNNTAKAEKKAEAFTNTDYERIAKLGRLRAQGLISEEEYRQAISKPN